MYGSWEVAKEIREFEEIRGMFEFRFCVIRLSSSARRKPNMVMVRAVTFR